jgi:hypothetical protein
MYLQDQDIKVEPGLPLAVGVVLIGNFQEEAFYPDLYLKVTSVSLSRDHNPMKAKQVRHPIFSFLFISRKKHFALIEVTHTTGVNKDALQCKL